MVIDLGSWEIGYGDGRLGRLPECPVNRDHASYLSGYVQGRAARGGGGRELRLRRSTPRQRRPRANRRGTEHKGEI
jgi:hypothetical protein